MTAEQVAASLRVTNPSWKIVASGDGITIERDVPDVAVPAELAMERNAIARRGGSAIQGTGPFAIQQWDAGKKLILSANNDYWDGRPYVDSVEILMGQGLREQMLALDLGKADVIEMAPEQAHRASTEGRHVESSDPSELMALVFAGNVSDEATAGLREALNGPAVASSLTFPAKTSAINSDGSELSTCRPSVDARCACSGRHLDHVGFPDQKPRFLLPAAL